MEFSTKTVKENSQMKTLYYIDDKLVDEKTYFSLQEEEFLKDTRKPSLVTNKNKINIKNDIQEDCDDNSCPEYDYFKNLIYAVKDLDEESAIDLLRCEFEFQMRQVDMQSKIDICDMFSKSMRTTSRKIRYDLEDYLFENGCDEDDYDEE